MSCNATLCWICTAANIRCFDGRRWLPIMVGCLLVISHRFVVGEEARDERPDTAGEMSEHRDGFLRLRYPTAAAGQVVDPLALDTGIVQFVPAKVASGELAPDRAVRVDLVAAVHVGEESYYAELNRRFTHYDVVLYELVAEDGVVITPEHAARRDHPVNMVQGGMQDALGLAHQLAAVDYQCSNFVRADMTPAEFAESMRKRDESFAKLFFRMAGNALAAQTENGGATDLRLLTAMLQKDRERQLKLAMAEQLFQLGGSLPALDGPDGSTLVTERNKKALQVLKAQLALGKKRIAIFYGAAHMPDMQERLETDFHLRRTSVEWIEAWNLEEATDEAGKLRPKKAVHE